MTAQDLWKEGRLGDAVAAQTEVVKLRPTDAEARYLLFALLCFEGRLERAERQLDALGLGDPKLETGTRIYRNLLASELERRAVWEAGASPVIPPDAPAGVARRLEAVRATAAGDASAASASLEAARAEEPDTAGRCDGTPFAAVLDTDDLLESTLEVFAGGRYVWLPFGQLRSLAIGEPSHALDLLWIPAKLVDAAGTEADVHLPALYPGSHLAGSEALRLGRATEWSEAGPLGRGVGQKVLFLAGVDGAEDRELPLLAVRALEVA